MSSSVEKKLVKAAKDVATMLGGDETKTAKTTSELLQKVLPHKATLQDESKRSRKNKINTEPNEDLMQIMYIDSNIFQNFYKSFRS